MGLKEGDKLRVIDVTASRHLFLEGQEVIVEQAGLRSQATEEELVKLYGYEGVFTVGQFEKIEEPVTLTNTPRPGDTPEMLAARLAPRGVYGPIHDSVARKELEARATPKHITTDPKVRAFSTGATRDLDTNKLDYEGFLSPLVLKRYAEHMHKARQMPNGDVRASDNWQLGIPKDVYMKSLFRHFFDVWSTHRGYSDGDIEGELCALLFNANGYLHEHLKAKRVLPSQ